MLGIRNVSQDWCLQAVPLRPSNFFITTHWPKEMQKTFMRKSHYNLLSKCVFSSPIIFQRSCDRKMTNVIWSSLANFTANVRNYVHASVPCLRPKGGGGVATTESRVLFHVLLQEVEARQPSTVLFAPPTSLPRVVCVMNQIHWG